MARATKSAAVKSAPAAAPFTDAQMAALGAMLKSVLAAQSPVEATVKPLPVVKAEPASPALWANPCQLGEGRFLLETFNSQKGKPYCKAYKLKGDNGRIGRDTPCWFIDDQADADSVNATIGSLYRKIVKASR